MRAPAIAVLLALALTPRAARADFLSCQADLKNQDCSDRASPLAVGETLRLGATCQVCTGGGSDLKCSPDEKVSAAGLGVETLAGAGIAGSFTASGSCPFGVPLFVFGGTLAAGSYRIVVTVAGFAKTELLTFAVGGGGPGGDGGKPAPREAGAAAGDGGTLPGKDGGTAGGDGKRTGDGGGGGLPPGSSEAGCDCAIALSAPPVWFAPLGLLLVGALLRSRRSR